MAPGSSSALFSSEYIGWRVVIFTAIFVPIQILTVGLRCFAKRLTRGPWGCDDVFVFASLFFQLVLAGICIASVRQGTVGYHTGYIFEHLPDSVLDDGRYMFAASTVYAFSVNIPKLAILVLYRRLFPAKRVRIIVYILAFVLVGISTANTIAVLAACRPFSANWNLNIDAVCIDKHALFMWGSLPNMITDLVMLVLPLPIIWRLQMDNSTKAGLTFTFIVGSLGLVTSIIRFKFFFEINPFLTDGTFEGVTLVYCTQAEPGTYLICACLLTYRPLLQKMGLGKLGNIVKRKKIVQIEGKNQRMSRFDGEGRRFTRDVFDDRKKAKSLSMVSVMSGNGGTSSETSSSRHDECDFKHDNRIIVRTEVRVESGVGDYEV